jgi:transposase-like protein
VKALGRIRRMATKPSPAASRGQDADRGRDLKALEQRRLKAARLFAHGTCQAKVACALGVSPQTASRWHARWQQGGDSGAARPRPPGPPAQAHPRPAPPARTGPTQGCPGARLRRGTVDASARRRGDLAACWGALPPWARVAHPARPGLERAAARPGGCRARRASDRPLGRPGDWPAIKETPTRAKPGCASWTSPQFR